MKVLVLNCGSSSIKYKLIEMEKEVVLASGQIERIGTKQALLKQKNLAGNEHKDVREVLNHDKGIELIIEYLTHPEYGAIADIHEIEGVGHRVVHGGDKFASSVIVDEEVKAMIRDCIDLAPLHNPNNLKGIVAMEKVLPEVKQVASFDTAFHQSLPKSAFLYAIPYRLYKEEAIRRYGFHGTSHKFVAGRAANMLKKDLVDLKIITCHLGNGGSITAIKDAKSMDTSMGFTPLEGIMMGTRSGDIDPAVLFYLSNKLDMSIPQIDDMLNKYSGLLGVSGVSNDMRELEAAIEEGSKRASLAKEMFVYKIKKYVGSYLAVLNGADLIVFTGGIGENNLSVRELICQEMSYAGIEIDDELNKKMVFGAEGEISKETSKVKVLVVATNEELVIARDTKILIEG